MADVIEPPAMALQTVRERVERQLAGVLIPLMFLIPLFARIELAQVDAQQAARDAVRSAALTPDATGAHAAASAFPDASMIVPKTPLVIPKPLQEIL